MEVGTSSKLNEILVANVDACDRLGVLYKQARAVAGQEVRLHAVPLSPASGKPQLLAVGTYWWRQLVLAFLTNQPMPTTSQAACWISTCLDMVSAAAPRIPVSSVARFAAPLVG